MLYHLLFPLHVHAGMHWLNVMRYVSTRIILATLTALAISFLLGPWFIDRLKAKQIGEQYQAGQSMNELARQYGVYRRTILHALERGNIPIRCRGLSPDRVAEASELYGALGTLAFGFEGARG